MQKQNKRNNKIKKTWFGLVSKSKKNSTTEAALLSSPNTSRERYRKVRPRPLDKRERPIYIDTPHPYAERERERDIIHPLRLPLL